MLTIDRPLLGTSSPEDRQIQNVTFPRPATAETASLNIDKTVNVNLKFNVNLGKKSFSCLRMLLCLEKNEGWLRRKFSCWVVSCSVYFEQRCLRSLGHGQSTGYSRDNRESVYSFRNFKTTKRLPSLKTTPRYLRFHSHSSTFLSLGVPVK